MDLSRFEWNGYAINHAISRNQGASTTHKGNVLFVHGFGASIGHWKKNMPALIDAGFKVHAIDLLGFGRSDKPADFTYSMEAWRDLLMAYVDAFVPSGESVVLVGNSIGSLASVLTAASLPPERVRGLVLVNCAGGMNNTAILDDDWRIRAVYPIILAINALLKIKPVGRFLFDKFRSRENVRGVLASVYCNPAAVDDALVDLIYEPSNDEGALETFVSIITGDPGPRPEPLVSQIAAPILLVWGDKDPFTPLDGPVGRFFQALPNERKNATLAIVKDCGHCPHDDRPERVNATLVPWLEGLPPTLP